MLSYFDSIFLMDSSFKVECTLSHRRLKIRVLIRHSNHVLILETLKS